MPQREPTRESLPEDGAWIAARLGRIGTVGGTLPNGYARYVRILHPVRLHGDRRITWRKVAARRGRVIHPAVQWGTVSAPASDDDDREAGRPFIGFLDRDRLAVLARLLRGAASAVPATMALWLGNPELDGLHAPSLSLPWREYALVAVDVAELESEDWPMALGILGSPRGGFLTPNLLWPSDRSWFVATEIDFDSTLVGGDDILADRLLAEPSLETVEVTVDTDLTSTADALNARPFRER